MDHYTIHPHAWWDELTIDMTPVPPHAAGDPGGPLPTDFCPDCHGRGWTSARVSSGAVECMTCDQHGYICTVQVWLLTIRYHAVEAGQVQGRPVHTGPYTAEVLWAAGHPAVLLYSSEDRDRMAAEAGSPF